MTEAVRQRLRGDMLLHVSPTGNDSNTGFTPSQSLRTLNEFYRRVRSDYDLAGYTLFAQLGDGDYEESDITCVAATIGAVQVIVRGNPGDPHAVRVRCVGGRNLFYSRDLGITTLRNLTLGTTGPGSRLVNVTTLSTIDLDGVSFEAAPQGIHIFVCQGFLVVQKNYRILGGASRHLSASDNGVAYYGGFTVEIPEPIAFDDFVVAEAGALVTAGGVPMKFAGEGLANCTGRKFHITSNGVLLESGTEFPGDAAGIGPDSALQGVVARHQALLAEGGRMSAEQQALLAESHRVLSESNRMSAEQQARLAESHRVLAESNRTSAEQQTLLAESHRVLAESNRMLAEQQALLTSMRNSRSWRMTAPLRKLSTLLRG